MMGFPPPRFCRGGGSHKDPLRFFEAVFFRPVRARELHKSLKSSVADRCGPQLCGGKSAATVTLKSASIRMPTFLHVGCGPKRKNRTTAAFNSSEWNEVRLDIDESVKPDITGTMTDMSAVAPGSVDAIFSSHNIEHLFPHEVPVALREFLRVLKDDGFAVITCPDLQSVCALVAQDKLTEPAYTSGAGSISPLDILYGHRPPMARGNLYMAHRCGFTRKVLIATLQAAGFKSVASVARPSHFDLWALCSKSARAEPDMRALARAHFPATQRP